MDSILHTVSEGKTLNMTSSRRIGLLFLLLCSGLSIVWGTAAQRGAPGGILDFQAVYYGTRCLLHHCDPYNESQLQRLFLAEDRDLPSGPNKYMQVVTLDVNLPTTSLIVAPLAMLPWKTAHLAWMILTGCTLIFAALLMWDVGTDFSPALPSLLIGFLLANLEHLFVGGNAAGIVVGSGIIAAWCFLKDRYAAAGVLCLAVSLAIKPHDAGFVWLYFLLAGGTYRRRALQTLAVTVVIGAATLLWVSHVAPHWLPELRSNLATTSAHGALNDQGPDSMTGRTPGMVVDLQGVVSIFRDDPRFYNPVSYLVCGSLLLLWAVKTLKLRASAENAWLALAAMVPLTMLVTYHRPNDAKLLLLTVPACAMLWARGGRSGRLAALVTTAGILFTADIPLSILVILANALHVTATGFTGTILTVALTRPASVALLIMTIFYLWVYVRDAPDRIGLTKRATQ